MAERTRRTPTRQRPSTQDVQAAAEGVGAVVGDGRKIELNGRSFRIADKIGLMPLLKFAHAASKGLDSNDMEGMVALYDVIRDCIEPGEWASFERHAIDTKAEGDELLAMVQKVIEMLSARPSKPPGGSSAGRRAISGSSKESSSSRAVADSDLISVDDLAR